MATTCAAVLVLPVVAFSLRYAIPVTMREVALALWRPVVAAAVMALAVRFVHPEAVPPIVRLGLDVAVGAAVFIAVQLGVWWSSGKPQGPERAILGLLSRARRT
jgi:hypothetical protein